jgi:hypothetical protein
MSEEKTDENKATAFSAATPCSFSLSEFEFYDLFRDAMETCPNLDDDWYRYSDWVSKSLYLLLHNATEEEVRTHIQEVGHCLRIYSEYRR